MFSPAISAASFGLKQNLQQYGLAAKRITNPDSDAGINEIVEMKKAEQGMQVNAAVIRTANEMTGLLVDMVV